MPEPEDTPQQTPPAYQPDLDFGVGAPPPGSTTDSFQARVEYAEFFAGPLPSPRTLAEYEAVHPGLVERIISAWESQSEHRQELEHVVIKSDAFAQRVGAVSGPVIALAAIGVGAWLIYQGRDPAGVALIVTGLGGLVSVFIYGKRSQRRELDEKDRESQPQRRQLAAGEINSDDAAAD